MKSVPSIYYKVWAVYLGLALVLQLTAGDFPLPFFAFPVNAACLLFGMVAVWVIYREKPHSWLAGVLGSPATVLLLVGALTVTCLAFGLTGYPQPASWWFVMLLLAVLASLFFTICKGLSRPRRHRVCFALNHVGLFMALAGGFAGAPDTNEWRMLAEPGDTIRKAFSVSGNSIDLGYELQLKRFDVARDSSGLALAYEAVVQADGKCAVLRVNQPYRLSWCDDLYLYGCGDAGCRSCILQLVRQPWKYMEGAGIVVLLCGSVLLFAEGFSVKRKGEEHANME